MTRLLLLLALALSACERALPPDAAPPETSDPARPPLIGTEWRLAAVGGTAPDALPGGDALVTVSFSDTEWDDEPGMRALGGFDGCNVFGMGYRIEGDPASAAGAPFRTGGLVSDAMACGEPGTHVSDRLHLGFGASRRARLSDGRLVFTDSLGAERLAFVPRPVHAVDPSAVTTGRWRLDPAASAVRNSYGGAPGRYTVAFAPDGTYAGEAGCLTFTGRYALDGDRLSVTSYAIDDQACAPDDRRWDGPNGLTSGEIEADSVRLVVHTQRQGRAVFVRP